jgi:hypothetical protein
MSQRETGYMPLNTAERTLLLRLLSATASNREYSIGAISATGEDVTDAERELWVLDVVQD